MSKTAAYRDFWAGVGERFPDLAGAVSTEYYADNGRRLFTDHFPALPVHESKQRTICHLATEEKMIAVLEWVTGQLSHTQG